MEQEPSEHHARIYELVRELRRLDPAERRVIDLLVERRLREARPHWLRLRLAQEMRLAQGKSGRRPIA